MPPIRVFQYLSYCKYLYKIVIIYFLNMISQEWKPEKKTSHLCVLCYLNNVAFWATESFEDKEERETGWKTEIR